MNNLIPFDISFARLSKLEVSATECFGDFLGKLITGPMWIIRLCIRLCLCVVVGSDLVADDECADASSDGASCSLDALQRRAKVQPAEDVEVD